jgi:glycosyltransferase involved in cell wall biosynthesis
VTQFKGCDTPEIAAILRELQIDVVIVNGWVVKTCLQTLWACKRLGIPCIVRGEANNLRHRPWWKRWLQRQLVRRYDAVLPIGKASREFYQSHGVSDAKMFVSPYCVENERFARAAAEAKPRRSQLRNRWNIPDNAVCYLYCGKFEQKKHPVELVEAFLQAFQSVNQSAADRPPIHLLMVGDGDLRRQCEQIASAFVTLRSLPYAPLTFAGFLNQSQIVEAYVAADVLVMPSDGGETWGLVVNEAMACGLPAIVSDRVGCASDLIKESETGWVFPFGNWQLLAERLLELCERPEEVLSMRSACQEMVSRYSPRVAAEGLSAAVNYVIHQ